jgi:hypothetical protein
VDVGGGRRVRIRVDDPCEAPRALDDDLMWPVEDDGVPSDRRVGDLPTGSELDRSDSIGAARWNERDVDVGRPRDLRTRVWVSITLERWCRRCGRGLVARARADQGDQGSLKKRFRKDIGGGSLAPSPIGPFGRFSNMRSALAIAAEYAGSESDIFFRRRNSVHRFSIQPWIRQNFLFWRFTDGSPTSILLFESMNRPCR